MLELTAYRTAGLRDAVASDPTLALTALAHALALKAFHPPYDQPSCLGVKLMSADLDGIAPGISDSPAGRRIGERHAAWAARLPAEPSATWGFLCGLGVGELMDLLAHCASLGISAVHSPLDRRPGAWDHADRLAQAAGLDMTAAWTATADRYLGRVTKPRILEAVTEGAGAEAAERLGGLKKGEMAEGAERLLAGTGWLPSLLRTPEAAADPQPAEPAEPAALAAE